MVGRKSNKNTDSFKAQQAMDKDLRKKKKKSELMLPKDLKGMCKTLTWVLEEDKQKSERESMSIN